MLGNKDMLKFQIYQSYCMYCFIYISQQGYIDNTLTDRGKPPKIHAHTHTSAQTCAHTHREDVSSDTKVICLT